MAIIYDSHVNYSVTTDFNTDTALHMPASFDTLTGHKLTVIFTKSVLKSKALGFGSCV